MSGDVFAESLKSPVCVEILFNCFRNVEKQMKIFILAKPTQEQQIKGKRQLNDTHDSVQFISGKLKEYEEYRAKKNEILVTFNRQSGLYRVKFQNLKSRLTSRSSTQRTIVTKYLEIKKKLKGKKNLITESLTANKMEKLKEARELHGFRNVRTKDGKIFCKLEGNDKPKLYYG